MQSANRYIISATCPKIKTFFLFSTKNPQAFWLEFGFFLGTVQVLNQIFLNLRKPSTKICKKSTISKRIIHISERTAKNKPIKGISPCKRKQSDAAKYRQNHTESAQRHRNRRQTDAAPPMVQARRRGFWQPDRYPVRHESRSRLPRGAASMERKKGASRYSRTMDSCASPRKTHPL